MPHVEVGKVITFSYEWTSRSAVPKNPKVVRVRNDRVWDEVVYSTNKTVFGMHSLFLPSFLPPPSCISPLFLLVSFEVNKLKLFSREATKLLERAQHEVADDILC